MHPVNSTNSALAGTGFYFGSPQPHQDFASVQQQSYLSPPRGPYYNTQNTYSSYSTPREQTEPPMSPPRIKRDDASSNLSMSSTIEETSSVMMDQPTSILKKMVVTTVTSKQQQPYNSAENIAAEGRQEVADDGRAAQNEFTSRVASPTREHLPPKKRKTMSRESVLFMEIGKLKADLNKAELKIKVLQEENEMLRSHRDTRYDMSKACSSTRSHLPFIPDLPSNTTSLRNGMFGHHNHHDHHHVMKQHYQVASRPDKDLGRPSPSHNLQIPQDVFIQSPAPPPPHHHQRDVDRAAHPYSMTTSSTEKYDRQQRDSSIQHDSSCSSSSRGDWIIPPNNNHIGSSPGRDTPKKISFALSFDTHARSSSSSKDSNRGYRCVSNRGGKVGSSRPPLASRWKTR